MTPEWIRNGLCSYQHCELPASIVRGLRGWRLAHLGNNNHNQIYESSREAVDAFKSGMLESGMVRRPE